MQKFQSDGWNADPPSVTSYLSYPNTTGIAGSPAKDYTSPVCGFGWGFKFSRLHEYRVSLDDPHVQELIGQVDVGFQPRLCSGMRLGNISIHVKATFPLKNNAGHEMVENSYANAHLNEGRSVGKYSEPFRLAGRGLFEITLTFDRADQLSFPTTPSQSNSALLTSALDGFSTIDTKFYLFSARIQGRPGRPRAVFADAKTLCDASSYMADLISGKGFHGGIDCFLDKDVPEAMTGLDTNLYDYESDSDLESLPDDDFQPNELSEPEQEDQITAPEEAAPGPVAKGKLPQSSVSKDPSVVNQTRIQGKGRGFTVNGTAHRTWKSLIFYLYTNEIHFGPLKSQRIGQQETPAKFPSITCSAKSMYRLADYVGMFELKEIAKEGIRTRISAENVVQELFSPFTSKYQELLEIYVDFLVAKMSPRVARELDDVLQLVVLGAKNFCHRTLAFAIRRMRGQDAKTAWAELDGLNTSADDVSEHGTEPAPEIPIRAVSPSTGQPAQVSIPFPPITESPSPPQITAPYPATTPKRRQRWQ